MARVNGGSKKRRTLPFDPIAEAERQWRVRWPVPVEMAAATSVMRAQQIILQEIEDALRPADLTFARYETLVLLYFSRRGSLPLGKMGDRLQVHPTSVTNSVDRLEAQGFVRRIRHEDDRRTILAEITPKGRRIVERATKQVTSARFGLHLLPRRDLRTLTEIIRKLRLAVGDFEDGGVPAAEASS